MPGQERFCHVLVVKWSYSNSACNMAKFLCTSQCEAWKNDISSSAQSKLSEALRQYFGLSPFRVGQLDALLSVAHGQDTFVRILTGGGKSLCMFLLPLSISSNALWVSLSVCWSD